MAVFFHIRPGDAESGKTVITAYGELPGFVAHNAVRMGGKEIWSGIQINVQQNPGLRRGLMNQQKFILQTCEIKRTVRTARRHVPSILVPEQIHPCAECKNEIRSGFTECAVVH